MQMLERFVTAVEGIQKELGRRADSMAVFVDARTKVPGGEVQIPAPQMSQAAAVPEPIPMGTVPNPMAAVAEPDEAAKRKQRLDLKRELMALGYDMGKCGTDRMATALAEIKAGKPEKYASWLVTQQLDLPVEVVPEASAPETLVVEDGLPDVETTVETLDDLLDEAPTPEKLTAEVMRDRLVKFGEKHGREAMGKLIQQHGKAERFQQVDPANWAALKAAAEEGLT